MKKTKLRALVFKLLLFNSVISVSANEIRKDIIPSESEFHLDMKTGKNSIEANPIISSSIINCAGAPTSALFGNTHVSSSSTIYLFETVSIEGIPSTDRGNQKGEISFDESASWVGASDSSYIDGFTKKNGTSSFTFPVGDDNQYRPLAISGYSASGQSASVSYYSEMPASVGSLGTDVDTMSMTEYWSVDGTGNTKVTLTWEASSEISNLTSGILSNLLMIAWDGLEWVEIPATIDSNALNVNSACLEYTMNSSSLLQGSITSESEIDLSLYQAFSFGSKQSANLAIKVFLEGPYSQATGLMNDDLRAGSYIPLTEPYSNSGKVRFSSFGGGGGEVTTNAVLTSNVGTPDAIVDWVFIELRSAQDSTVVEHTIAALLQRDGDIVDPSDGISDLSIIGQAGASYYVAVKHRNHLGVMTANPILLDGTTTFDFSTAAPSEIYSNPNNSISEMKDMGGTHVLWAGNSNADVKVKYQGPNSDLQGILIDVISFPDNTSFLYNYNNALGYFFGDLNMDGKVKYLGSGSDSNILFLNILVNGHPQNFNLFIENLP